MRVTNVDVRTSCKAVVNTRELSGYVANNCTTIFHHAGSVSVITVAVLSRKSKLLSQYWMPNALVDVIMFFCQSSYDTR